MTMMMMMRQMGRPMVRNLFPARAVVRHQKVLERSQLEMCARKRVLIDMDRQWSFHVLNSNNVFTFYLFSDIICLCYGFSSFNFLCFFLCGCYKMIFWIGGWFILGELVNFNDYNYKYIYPEIVIIDTSVKIISVLCCVHECTSIIMLWITKT